MIEDSGRGWRKVVSSPHPREIVEVDAVRALLDKDQIVIAGGGGGIPVVRDADGSLRGVEAVIDKDYTASLLAREVRAHLFVILTAVDRIFINFNTPHEKPLRKLTPGEAIAFQTVTGPVRPRGRYALAAADGGTRVRLELKADLKGVRRLMSHVVQSTMNNEVGQLHRLKRVIEQS